MKIISKIANFIKEHQDRIAMVISVIIIEFALFSGIYMVGGVMFKLLYVAAAIMFPIIVSAVVIYYSMTKAQVEFSEKEYDLAKKVSDITFEHMGSSCNHISVATEIIKERCQNMYDLAEIYMSKNKSDNEYHNAVLDKVMESLEIIAKELDKKNN